jgi:hypothetical protein
MDFELRPDLEQTPAEEVLLISSAGVTPEDWELAKEILGNFNVPTISTEFPSLAEARWHVPVSVELPDEQVTTMKDMGEWALSHGYREQLGTRAWNCLADHYIRQQGRDQISPLHYVFQRDRYRGPNGTPTHLTIGSLAVLVRTADEQLAAVKTPAPARTQRNIREIIGPQTGEITLDFLREFVAANLR